MSPLPDDPHRRPGHEHIEGRPTPPPRQRPDEPDRDNAADRGHTVPDDAKDKPTG